MYSFYANAWNEAEKLWQRRRTKAFLLLAILGPILCALWLTFLQNNLGVFGGMGGNLPMLMLGLFTFALLPLFLFMTAADSFAGEEAARTLKLTLVRPVTRAKVFASKMFAIAFFVAVQLGVLWVTSVVSGSFVPGAELTLDLLDSVMAYTAAFVPMLAIGLIAAIFAQCFRSASGAMAMIIVIYAAARLLPFVFPQASVWSVFSYTNWYVLWVGNGVSMDKLLNSFVILLSYCIIAYTAGWMLFDRKQL